MSKTDADTDIKTKQLNFCLTEYLNVPKCIILKDFKITYTAARHPKSADIHIYFTEGYKSGLAANDQSSRGNLEKYILQLLISTAKKLAISPYENNFVLHADNCDWQIKLEADQNGNPLKIYLSPQFINPFPNQIAPVNPNSIDCKMREVNCEYTDPVIVTTLFPYTTKHIPFYCFTRTFYEKGTVAFLDPKKFMQSFAHGLAINEPQYLKRPNRAKALQYSKGDHGLLNTTLFRPQQMGFVNLDSERNIRIYDGRHRTVNLIALGANAIPLTIRPEDLAQATQLYGVENVYDKVSLTSRSDAAL